MLQGSGQRGNSTSERAIRNASCHTKDRHGPHRRNAQSPAQTGKRKWRLVTTDEKSITYRLGSASPQTILVETISRNWWHDFQLVIFVCVVGSQEAGSDRHDRGQVARSGAPEGTVRRIVATWRFRGAGGRVVEVLRSRLLFAGRGGLHLSFVNLVLPCKMRTIHWSKYFGETEERTEPTLLLCRTSRTRCRRCATSWRRTRRAARRASRSRSSQTSTVTSRLSTATSPRSTSITSLSISNVTCTYDLQSNYSCLLTNWPDDLQATGHKM